MRRPWIKGLMIAGPVVVVSVAVLLLVRKPNDAVVVGPKVAGWPFDAREAKRRQAEAARALGVPVTKEIDLGDGVKMRLVLIPAGEFVMGTPASEKGHCDDEAPQHRVKIAQAFYMTVYEVTQEQCERVIGYAPSYWVASSYPVDKAHRDQVDDFCRNLKAWAGVHARLPTEAEWEYACRAGAATAYCFGNDVGLLDEYAWFTPRFNWFGCTKTQAVGQKEPNAWGLHDMHGNVLEWCQDWYDADYYKNSPLDNPLAPANGQEPVLRGGSSDAEAADCRSGSRHRYDARRMSNVKGFRVVVLPGLSPTRIEEGPWVSGWPFDAREAKRRQAEAARLLGVSVEQELDLGGGVKIKFVLIPAGQFVMGSPASEEGRDGDEGPQHKVEITESFYMGIHEVTQQQYERVMGDNPSHFKDPERPVETISWNEAVTFCGKLGVRSSMQVRLPTEAEWEYACRAGAATRYYFGDYTYVFGDYGWYRGNTRDRTQAVGQKLPNAWGLHDMHGNVKELCQDWYHESYYRDSPLENPRGPQTGHSHVARGGSFRSAVLDIEGSAARSAGIDPPGGSIYLGFRVVMVP